MVRMRSIGWCMCDLRSAVVLVALGRRGAIAVVWRWSSVVVLLVLLAGIIRHVHDAG